LARYQRLLDRLPGLLIQGAGAQKSFCGRMEGFDHSTQKARDNRHSMMVIKNL